MTTPTDLGTTPADLPVPEDDGACDHLPGRALPGLALPTFEADGRTLIRRLTLIATNGTIEKVFYPVFPPERNAADVLAWLEANPA